jgi:hypothetical protein
MGERLRFGRAIETRAADLARQEADDAVETRLGVLEAWLPHLQAGMMNDEYREAIGETIGAVVQDAVDELKEHGAAALRKAVTAVREEFQAEIAAAFDDLSARIEAKIWPTIGADWDPQVVKQVVADLRAEPAKTKTELNEQAAGLAAKLAAMESRLRQRDEVKVGLLEKLAGARSEKRELSAKVDEPAAANRRLRSDFESLVEPLAGEGVIRPSEPALLPALGTGRA